MKFKKKLYIKDQEIQSQPHKSPLVRIKNLQAFQSKTEARPSRNDSLGRNQDLNKVVWRGRPAYRATTPPSLASFDQPHLKTSSLFTSYPSFLCLLHSSNFPEDFQESSPLRCHKGRLQLSEVGHGAPSLSLSCFFF